MWEAGSAAMEKITEKGLKRGDPPSKIKANRKFIEDALGPNRRRWFRGKKSK